MLAFVIDQPFGDLVVVSDLEEEIIREDIPNSGFDDTDDAGDLKSQIAKAVEFGNELLDQYKTKMTDHPLWKHLHLLILQIYEEYKDRLPSDTIYNNYKSFIQNLK